ncbi:hypothetical protein KIW84_064504 [Lathyrus oleraceus]|uniref:DNA replication factor Dna2 N-terminal domain-containing protein n=1 Tax=Pisum sativum TaxID=3888 RepID=A0A9D5A897_PEA|nr:hypothetical protein KIW84_064504 [Pisum sativum]
MDGPPDAKDLQPFVLSDIQASNPDVRAVRKAWLRVNLKEERKGKAQELEDSNKRARLLEDQKDDLDHILLGSTSVIRTRKEELKKAEYMICELGRMLDKSLMDKKEIKLDFEAQIRDLRDALKKCEEKLSREILQKEEAERNCHHLRLSKKYIIYKEQHVALSDHVKFTTESFIGLDFVNYIQLLGPEYELLKKKYLDESSERKRLHKCNTIVFTTFHIHMATFTLHLLLPADSSAAEGPYKVLRLLNEQTGEERAINLWDKWSYSVIAPGDTVNVIGQFDEGGNCDINHDNNFLIVHPDILVSGTRVAASFSCPRRTVLDERLKSNQVEDAIGVDNDTVCDKTTHSFKSQDGIANELPVRVNHLVESTKSHIPKEVVGDFSNSNYLILEASKKSQPADSSATVPNAKEFADWVAKVHQQPCHIVYTDYRPN